MRDRKSIASVLIYVGSALCFFLPFVTVSCAGMKIGTFTGQQLATGVHPSESVPGVSVNTQGYNGDPLAAVAFLCAIAGVGLSLAGRKLAAVTSASGGVGTIALLMMKSRLTDQIQAQIGGQNAGIVQVNVEPGLMFAVSLLAAGAALNLYVLFHREENAAAIAGAGDVYGTVNSGPPGWKAASEPQTPTEVQAQVGVATRVSRFCRRCGTPVSDGKRFCSQCGLEIAQRQEAPKPADVVPNETSAPEPAVVTEATVPPAAAAAFAAKAPEVPFFAPAAEPVHTVTQYVEPVFVESSIEPEEKGIVVVPSRKTGPAVWLIMAIASVLVIAAAAVWIYEWHRGATIASLFGSSNTSEPATSPQVQPQPQAQVLPQPQTPNPESEVQQKSPAGVAEDHPSAQVTSSSTGKRQVTNPTQGKNTVAGGNVASTTSNPQDQTPPPHAVVANPPVVNPPQLPTNGMLHYSGPPVPFGGTVTFTGLPGGRLRFTFDHSAWQPLISRQPDGTQTLTLRSLKQVVQTQCEVAWAIVQ